MATVGNVHSDDELAHSINSIRLHGKGSAKYDNESRHELTARYDTSSNPHRKAQNLLGGT